MAAPATSYFIADGVRRCVAAREAGLSSIEGKVIVPGQADVVATLSLNQLFSPKTTIIRNARYLRIEIATIAGKQLPCFEVQPLGAVSGQTKPIPLVQVVLS